MLTAFLGVTVILTVAGWLGQDTAGDIGRLMLAVFLIVTFTFAYRRSGERLSAAGIVIGVVFLVAAIAQIA